MKRYTSAESAWSISLPDRWLVRPAKEEKAVLSLDVTVREGTLAGYGRISLFFLERMTRAEAQAFAEKAVQTARYGGEDAHIGLDPLPHLEFRYASGGRRFAVLMVYRMVRGRGVSFSAVFDLAAYSAIRPLLFEAAKSVETVLDPPRVIPEGWTVRRKGSFTYGIHPDYSGNPGAFHLFLSKEEKAFVRFHGAFTPEPDRPAVVLLFPPGKGPVRSGDGGGTGFDEKKVRLLACTVPPKRSMERALLAREATRFFYTLRYGNLLPLWISVGEGEIALERARTGRALPWVTRDRLDRLRGAKILPFVRLTGGLEKEDLAAFTDLSFLYCTLFHEGSRKLRKAFLACLKAFHKTGDWDTAEEEHLLSLDPEALRKEAVTLAKKGLHLVR